LGGNEDPMAIPSIDEDPGEWRQDQDRDLSAEADDPEQEG
jgi:hypothetical protein